MKMTKLLLFLVVALLLPVCAHAQKDQRPWEMKLPFESATVVYSISGMEKGKETVYLKDWGKRKATHNNTVTNVMGMRSENRTLDIEDPDYIYSFDLIEKTGTRATNPAKIAREEYEKLSAADKRLVDKNSKELGITLQQGVPDAVEENVTEILGQKCDRTELMGTVAYTAHDSGILLKSETNMMGVKISIVATSFSKGDVDEKYFALPKGIKPVHDPEADAMTRNMIVQTMEWLKDPEAARSQPQMMNMRAAAMEADGAGQGDIEEAMKQAEQMMKGFGDLLKVQ